jgi:hypothetical protein
MVAASHVLFGITGDKPIQNASLSAMKATRSLA